MKKNVKVQPARKKHRYPEANLIWGFLAAVVWTGVQFFHASSGASFSPVVYSKGLLLLCGAAAIFHFSVSKGFSFLGMFPLLWLAVSTFQWDLCAQNDFQYWLWLVLFLVSEILIFLFPEGKKLLACLVPLWFALSYLFSFSLLLPLIFLSSPRGRFKESEWVRWGGLVTCLVLMVFFRGWRSFHFDWIGIYDLFFLKRYAAFFLLGWLGLIAFPKKGVFRHLVFPVFFLTAGFLLFGEMGTFPAEVKLLKWVLVFFGGFGWESFRRDIMDPSWHGSAVWVSLGLALFGGVI